MTCPYNFKRGIRFHFPPFFFSSHSLKITCQYFLVMISSDFPAAHINYPLPKIYLRCVLLPTAAPLPILRFQISDFLATVRSFLLIYTYQRTVLLPHRTPIPVTYSISHLSPVWSPWSIPIITFSLSQLLFPPL